MSLSDLTENERQVLFARIEGERQKDIAYRMGLSIKTVSVHQFHACKKINAPSLRRARHIVKRLIEEEAMARL